MTNAEKYKGAKERAEAFRKYHDEHHHGCRDTPYVSDAINRCVMCMFKWLDLEAAAEEPLPCPFCEEQCSVKFNFEDRLVVECSCCTYSSASYDDETQAVAAHNRVARAAKEKEANDAND